MSTDCALAEELYDLYPFQAVQWTYILFSVAAIILVIYTARNYLNRTIFENVTKELIIFLYAYIAMYSITLIIVQLSQLVYRYTAKAKCDAQVPKIWCLLRYINTVIVCSFLVIHIGITAQHALSTFKFNIQSQTIAARCSITLSFVYPIVLGCIAYRNESLQGRIPYCSGVTASSSSVFTANIFFLFTMDIFNTLISLLLWKYNHHRFSHDQSFDLRLTFHRRQNLYAMQQFLPIAIVHAGIYTVFIVSNYVTRTFRYNLSPGWALFTTLVVNVMPVYCFLCPLAFLVLIRRGRFKRVSHVQNLLDSEQNPNLIDMNIQLPSDCASAEELYDLVPLQAVQWFYISLSFASIILIVYTARNYLHRTIFENELIIFLYFFIAIYSISLILTQCSQLTYRYIAMTKCDAQVPRMWCFPRYVNTVIVCPLLVLHVGITAQHALSTFRFSDRAQVTVARCSIVISFVYPTLLGVFAYWNESLEGRVPYCSSITANNVNVFNTNLYFLFGMDMLNMLVSMLLWKYNKHRLAHEQSYNLAHSFHRRQNLYAMQQFAPIATAHAVIYGVFIAATYTSRSLRTYMTPGGAILATLIANIMPIYCVLCPLIFLVLIRRGKFERVARVKNLLDTEQKSNQVYFAALKDQWK